MLIRFRIQAVGTQNNNPISTLSNTRNEIIQLIILKRAHYNTLTSQAYN